MYSPWPDGSFLDDAEQYVAAAQKNTHKSQKVYHLRSSKDGVGALADLVHGDRLYIMGHGIPFIDDKIKGDYMWKGPEQQGYSTYNVDNKEGDKFCYPALTPLQLLDKLSDHAILNIFAVTDIRLWVCKSGDKGVTTFAWDFTKLITQINPKVIVTAYSGFMLLRTRTGKKRGDVDRKDPNAESKPAKDFKVVINPPVQRSQVVFKPLCIDTDWDYDFG